MKLTRYPLPALLISILGVLTTPLLIADEPEPLDFTWNGAGVSGGTGSHEWSDPSNWLVDGSANAGNLLPTLIDDVTVIFDTGIPDDTGEDSFFGIRIPDGATAANVLFNGYSNISGNNRAIVFEEEGDVFFERIDFATSTTNRIYFEENARVHLSGSGDASDPTFVFRGTSTSAYNQVASDPGRLIISASTAHLSLPDARLAYSFTNPTGTVVPVNRRGTVDLFEVRDLSLHRGQDWSAVAGIRLFGSIAGIHNLDTSAGLLDNLGHIYVDFATGETPIAGGTYGSFTSYISSGAGANWNQITLQDSVTLTGTRGETGNWPEHALYLSRQGSSSYVPGNDANGNRIIVADGLFSVLTTSVPVYLGDPDYDVTQNLRPSGVYLQGGDAYFAGDVIVGYQGILQADEGRTLRLGGDFHNKSRLGVMFDLTEATVILEGSGTEEAPQLFEINGLDVGPDAELGMTNNFGIGRLEVGTALTSTYVELIDLHDRGAELDGFPERYGADGLPDALYLNELFVHAGSTLFIGEFAVYVDGQVLDQDHLDFALANDLYGEGLIVIPEWSGISGLIGGLLVIGLLRRRIKKS